MIKLASAKGLKVYAEVRKGDPAVNEAGDLGAECISIGAGGFDSNAYDSSNSVMTQLAKNASCSVEIVR